MKRILTGLRTTGPLHIGHYVGMLKQTTELQDDYETFFMMADIQSLTDNYDNPEKVRENVKEVILDSLSVGLDPNKVTFFIQSQIPQIAELTVLFANLVSVQQLSHNPTVKTELKEKGMEKSTPLGFFMYPVSQAADITFVRGELVPVGEDQLPHIEQTRDIVKKFNSLYSNVFPIPKGKVTESPRLMGTDGGAKMGKSLGNVISLSDSSEEVKKKVMAMYTDPNRIHATDPGKVEGNPVFVYHDALNPNTDEVNDLKDRYRKGTVGDVEVKTKLYDAIENVLEPIRAKRAEYENSDTAMDILMEGTKKALVEGEKTMELVRKAVKIDY